MDMEFCIFCDAPLAPGSVEHVFLAALGGRVATRRATCSRCNNSFARGDKIDDALADTFVIPRCGLQIWGGRKKPPPTIHKAGSLDGGPEYDLAPGFVSVARPARVPARGAGKASVFARDEKDAIRVLRTLGRRGNQANIIGAARVQQRVPRSEFSVCLDGPSIWRSMAKTALVGSCLMFGNQTVRSLADPALLRATRSGDLDISAFAGWDFVNPWPSGPRLTAHRARSNVAPSGFEHSLIVCDVAGHWVAYLELLGNFRFSVRMGRVSGKALRGLSVNPRTGARYTLVAAAPKTYVRRRTTAFKEEHATTLEGVRRGMKAVMNVATSEAKEAWMTELLAALRRQVGQACDDRTFNEAINAWSCRVAAHISGVRWKEKLDTEVLDGSDYFRRDE